VLCSKCELYSEHDPKGSRRMTNCIHYLCNYGTCPFYRKTGKLKKFLPVWMCEGTPVKPEYGTVVVIVCAESKTRAGRMATKRFRKVPCVFKLKDMVQLPFSYPQEAVISFKDYIE